jgi:ElaB/YqjD/DUF883 family membrane-anchored ribosome-binding protein
MINRLPKEYLPDRPTGGLRPASAAAGETAEGVQSMSNRMLTAAANSVGAHPVISLGVALAAGILLGKLVKR